MMRSLLFVPGDSERKLEKSLSAGADVLLIETGETGAIKIEQIREATERAAYRPFEGRRRVIIIDDAEQINPNAQDALLQRRATGRDPIIEVCTESADDKVRLSVSDNGDGFPEELMTRIFEPYVTTKPRGTGLGLAIVKKIVDEHRGSISIESNPARGASVRVLLPLAKAA